MHVDRAERLTRPREDPGELLDVLGRFRWRLAREQLLLYGLRGLIASCAILTAVSVTAWLVGNSLLNPWTVAALAAGPVIGLLVALVRWPSTTHAARIADTQLGLAERLSTAVELVDRTPHGRFDDLQVRDAIATAQAEQRPLAIAVRCPRRRAARGTRAGAGARRRCCCRLFRGRRCHCLASIRPRPTA